MASDPAVVSGLVEALKVDMAATLKLASTTSIRVQRRILRIKEWEDAILQAL